MPKEGSPETEFRQHAGRRTFFRKFYNDKLRFPDGLEAEIWAFEDERSGRVFPAPLIRAEEGDIVHVTLKPSKRVHTIHLHGIEPDPRNDGVGHTSFEVTGEYTYQFRAEPGVPGDPNTGTAGTYFYHCHVNTVLHVQIGMFGPMIFDPASGRGKAFVDDPVGYDPRAETLLVPYVDRPALAQARPRRRPRRRGRRPQPLRADALLPARRRPQRAPGAARRSSRSGTILTTAAAQPAGAAARQQRQLLPDRRPLRRRPARRGLRPRRAPAAQHRRRRRARRCRCRTTVLAFGAAERYDMRLRPPAGARVGDTYPLTVEWRQWVTNRVIATRTATVKVI